MTTKTEYQVSDHGCGRKSVQVFRDKKTIADHDIVRDVNGWKVVAIRPDGWGTDGPQFGSPEAAARHFATTI